MQTLFIIAALAFLLLRKRPASNSDTPPAAKTYPPVEQPPSNTTPPSNTAPPLVETSPINDALYRASVRAGARFGVPVKTLLAMAEVESAGGRNTWAGTSGEIGAFQILPSSADMLRNIYPELRMIDINTIDGNAFFAGAHLHYTAGILRVAIDSPQNVVAYNAGPRSSRVLRAETDWYYLRYKAALEKIR